MNQQISFKQWIGTNYAEIADFCPEARWQDGVLTVTSLDKIQTASLEDFVVKKSDNTFYVCSPLFFTNEGKGLVDE